MTDQEEPTLPKFQFTLTRFICLVAVIGLAFTPVSYAGWRAIVPSVFLLTAGTFAVFGKIKSTMATLGILILGFSKFDTMQGARPAIHRIECSSNLKRIAMALHDYHEEHGELPPPYTVSSDGTPLHSWRVLILPYLEEQALYEQIDLDQPWDSPKNSLLHEQMPECYCCPAVQYNSMWYTKGDTTDYVGVIGDNTAWPVAGGRKFFDATDGTSNSIFVIESKAHRVVWMAPNDPSLETFMNEIKFEGPHAGGCQTVFIDGSVRFISATTDHDTIRKLITIDDGAVISDY